MKWVGLLAVLILLAGAPSAFGWGYATHTVVGDRLYKQDGAKNADEIYGACAPDMFNMLGPEYPVYGDGGLYQLVHANAGRLWDVAHTGREKSLAFGFASHSDVFGADFTAHHAGITYGQGHGYIVQKAYDMQGLLAYVGADLASILAAEGESIDEADEIEIYHDILEFATDVLTARIDPTLGPRLSDAARKRSDAFPALFYRAYQDELDAMFGSAAPDFVAGVEAEFRAGMIEYGMLLSLDEETLIPLLVEYIADFAGDYLASLGIELPPGFEPEDLIGPYLALAIELCEGDYGDELVATQSAVETELADRGIYGSADFMRRRR